MTSINRIAQIASDATGKWAFYLPMFYFAAPLSILSSVLQDFDPKSPSTFWLWLIASSIGYLAMLTVAMASDISKLKFWNQKRIPIMLYLFLSFAIGATKGATTGFIGGLLVQTTVFDNALIPRTFTSGLIALFVIPAGSAFLASRDRFASARDELIREAVQIESLTRQNASFVTDLHTIAAANPDSKLEKQIEELLRELTRLKKIPIESQWELISAGLKKIIYENIRPISKMLWQDKQRDYPALTFKDLISLSIKQFEFPMWFVIGANIFGTTGQFLRHSQGQSLGITLTWTSLSIAIPYVFFRFLVKRKILGGFWSFLLLLICAVSLETIRLHLDASSSVSNLIITFNSLIFGIFLAATLLTGGVIQCAMQTQSEVLSRLSALVDQDRIILISSNIETESKNREVAKFLHGHLQTRLMSMALALELSGKDADFEKVQKTIQNIELELDIPLKRISPQQVNSFEEIIDRISKVWEGIVQIDHQITDAPHFADLVLFSNVATILEEAVTNAVRHGQATKVLIDINHSSDEIISIRVTDNGNGIKTNYTGLGTGLITSICGNNWSIFNSDDGNGATLVANMPKR